MGLMGDIGPRGQRGFKVSSIPLKNLYNLTCQFQHNAVAFKLGKL